MSFTNKMSSIYDWINNGFDYDNIELYVKNIIDESIENYKIFLELPITEKTFQKLINMLAKDIDKISTVHTFCSFMQFVNPEAKLKQKFIKSDAVLNEYTNSLNGDINIYKKITHLFNYGIRFNASDIDIKFIKKIINGYKRNGIDISKKRKDKLLDIKSKINNIERGIFNFICNNNITIKINVKYLEGIPSIYLNNFNRINEDCAIPLNKSNYNICMTYIKTPKIRKHVEFIYHNQHKKVTKDFIQLLSLRQTHAELLGYNNHAEYRISDQMAGTTENIQHFLLELLEEVDVRYSKEIETLSRLKKKDGLPEQLDSWDIQYYTNMWKNIYGLDENTVREYFPLNKTLINIMKVYQNLFNIKFIKKDTEFKWNEDVILYLIYQEDKLMGYLFFDIFKRKGKYDKIRCFSLKQYSNYIDLEEHPVSILLASFNKPEQNHVLLNHRDVISIFHELGHIMHLIFGKIKYSLLSGTNVENDFIETPAQILDMLCWNNNIIKSISNHYVSGKSLPENIIKKMVKIKNLNVGISYKRNILIGIYDQLVHSSKYFIDNIQEIITKKLEEHDMSTISNFYRQLFSNIMNDINFNDNILYPCSIINFIGNGDARYYTNVWCKVQSSDVYCTKFIDKNIEQLKYAIREFIEKILKHGGSINSFELMMNYLNRKPSFNGFVNIYNLDVQVSDLSYYINTEKLNTETFNKSATFQRKEVPSEYDSEININDNNFSIICSDSESF